MSTADEGTAARDVVVVGASAGGVEALVALAAGLPADLSATVLVVMHLPETRASSLAQILDRAGPLPAAEARDGELLRPGRVLVAVPDRHLLIHRDRVLLSTAPKQNRSRPSVDTLFRSAARWRGAHAAGVVLSGALDDGAAGLAAIVADGGGAVVQDPRDAAFTGMPEAALAVVPAALVCPAAEAGNRLSRLIRERAGRHPAPAPSADLVRETEMMENAMSGGRTGTPGTPVGVSCPDCTGAMNGVRTGAAVHYVCHVGHSWSPQALASAQREKIEQALWTAVSMLEEQAAVHRQVAAQALAGDAILTARHQRAAADEALRAAGIIRRNFPDLLPHTGITAAAAGTGPTMSDDNPEQYAEYATQDGPGSADVDRVPEEQEAHGGSMAPGLVDDAGRPVAEVPDTAER